MSTLDIGQPSWLWSLLWITLYIFHQKTVRFVVVPVSKAAASQSKPSVFTSLWLARSFYWFQISSFSFDKKSKALSYRTNNFHQGFFACKTCLLSGFTKLNPRNKFWSMLSITSLSPWQQKILKVKNENILNRHVSH